VKIAQHADDGAVVGKDRSPRERADQVAREERDDDEPQQQRLVTPAAKRDHVGKRVPDGDAQQRRGARVDERPAELLVEL
jgi:hypothetical protein